MSVDVARLQIEADSTQVRSASRDLKELEIQSSKTELSAKNTASTIKSVGAAIAASFATYQIQKFVKEVTLAYARFETLGVVMKQVGQNAGFTSNEMVSAEMQLRQYGIAMTESRLILTKMVQAQIKLSDSSKLARIAQDAAVIGNINSSEAFSKLIHGIQTAQTETLRTIGITVKFEDGYKKLAAQLGKNADQLTEVERTQARVNLVMEAGTRISGVYEAAMETAGKKFGSMTRHVDDLMVVTGKIFDKTFSEGIDAVTEILKVTKTWIEANEELLQMGFEIGLSNIIEILKILVVLIGARLVASLTASGVAVTANTQQWIAYQLTLARFAGVSRTAAAAQLALSASLKAGSAIMAALGGPVGVAVIAATAIYSFREELGLVRPSADSASEAVEKLSKNITKLTEAQAKYRQVEITSELSSQVANLAKITKEIEKYRKILDTEELYGGEEDVKNKILKLEAEADSFRQVIENLQSLLNSLNLDHLDDMEGKIQGIDTAMLNAYNTYKTAAEDSVEFSKKMQESIDDSAKAQYESFKASFEQATAMHALNVEQTEEAMRLLDELKRKAEGDRKAELEQIIEDGKAAAEKLEEIEKANLKYTMDLGILQNELQNIVNNGLEALTTYNEEFAESTNGAAANVKKLIDTADELLENQKKNESEFTKYHKNSYKDYVDNAENSYDEVADANRRMWSRIERDQSSSLEKQEQKYEDFWSKIGKSRADAESAFKNTGWIDSSGNPTNTIVGGGSDPGTIPTLQVGNNAPTPLYPNTDSRGNLYQPINWEDPLSSVPGPTIFTPVLTTNVGGTTGSSSFSNTFINNNMAPRPSLASQKRAAAAATAPTNAPVANTVTQQAIEQAKLKIQLENEYYQLTNDTAVLRKIAIDGMNIENVALYDRNQAMIESNRQDVITKSLMQEFYTLTEDTNALRTLAIEGMSAENILLYDKNQELKKSVEQERIKTDLENEYLQLTNDTIALREIAIEGMNAENIALYDRNQALIETNRQLDITSDLMAEYYNLTGDTNALRKIAIEGMNEENIALYDRNQAIQESNQQADITSNLMKEWYTLTEDTNALRLIAIDGMSEENILLYDSIEAYKLSKLASEEATAAEERLKDARLNATDNIQNLIDNLMGGSSAPVQSMEFFERRYDQLKNDAFNSKGTEEFDNKISALTSFIPGMLDFAAAYGGDYLSVWNKIMGDLSSLGGDIPQFERGGFHSGGLAMVHGQEIISMGQSSISNKQETFEMIREAVKSAGNGNISLIVKVGDRELKEIIIEEVHNNPQLQNEIRRIA